ncbi:MAG TPA: hypothetical protein VL362_01840 [Patescibacteria group bacterium]|nr:hypothetical protein [Patescibacteria group bacterium]
MKKQKKNSRSYIDTVAQDFRRAIVVVSLSANLILFVTWVTYMVSSSNS